MSNFSLYPYLCAPAQTSNKSSYHLFSHQLFLLCELLPQNKIDNWEQGMLLTLWFCRAPCTFLIPKCTTSINAIYILNSKLQNCWQVSAPNFTGGLSQALNFDVASCGIFL